ncbi:BolA family protein [Henriciella mobilis]|uniref:BolA family transcriptional regulator n=1 Tax=Henriciella mobilis TaxID=2305467 RepID=A0A399RT13_9PROT|nr:BolA family transcriptional regulator [Henriciella mobilis]RIJ15925.1 BolA family transcriptional regulator [Henriciella mobilis]RIJ21135.1 BolA family transcriptional regulator [Henriciella mobilis]RIJ32625.1 BolA family transcriptional regulator [Henriciella mobilis]
MAMDRATLETHLKEAFPDAEITLTDLAGDNDHWQAEIVSEQFKGVSRVKQHQMVYAALKGKMGGELHALALKTSAPA